MSGRNAIGVIVVNWNAGQTLQRCVASLLHQTRPPARIIIVDNDSKDGSVELVARLDPRVEIVQLEGNAGFAAANNVGIKLLSDCKWVALLNPDAFAEPDWLQRLMDSVVENPRFTFFASRMLSDSDPNVLDGAGDGYHFTGMPGRRGYGLNAAGRYLEQDEVFSACAAAALYRRDILAEVGGFDESFFCYMEDMDLGFRLRLRGYRCLYVPTAIVRHVGSGTTGKQSDIAVYYGHRNLVWTFVKNMPLFWLVILFVPHLIMNLAVVFWFTRRGKGRLIVRSKWTAVRALARVLHQREEVAKNRKCSVWHIAGLLSSRVYR